MGHENAAVAGAAGVTQGFDADLLVVGLGPAGDVLAGLACQWGLSVIAIDQAAGIHPLPRAATFDAEIMRIFQMLGAAAAVLPATHLCKRYQFISAQGAALLDFDLTAQPSGFGWANSYALFQPQVEAALRARLAELGCAIRTGTRFVELSQDADGVTSTLQTEAGSQAVRTKFVVGCDGAGSAIRGAMGARLFDYAFDEPWLVLDAVADAPLEMPDGVMQFCDPQRPATYMRMGARRHRWEFMIKPGEDAAALLAPARLGALLAPFAPMERLTIERQAVYRFHGLLAEQWRCGRVLIAGDAAHQMPPFAGQGMCAAIRDSANLAWKLAWIIRGRAGMGLLDSYQQERAPHVRVIVERAIAMGRVVCLLDPVAAAARDAEMLARKAAGAEEISLAMPDLTAGLLTATAGAGGLFPQFVVDGVWLDDVLGAGPWLIGAVPAAAAGIGGCWTLEADTLAPFAGALRAWLAGHAAPAVLVRPDRVVFGTGAADGLIAQWEQMLM